ncbi:DUF1800 domain-containing protein [Pseudoalteromonas luteoviolacea]|uniref:DUF1800 domain-containing protein n=1 Tax=Pseudoalteromonas luteoviolacea (strain 2ta16) TaxID=1353533 RepID=V4HZP7_PSEL2|nr:DUF1800 family protein [Pseudoalteromonas luteoviolacea]ESP93439.1 hypothetical protein PL2TA16_03292 [Pseudoalteromonas luteoviolacea 2ta16]KZN43914.1 hypothetical protein N483_08315 [Pseudoalteromonas luteoviolacea NCIMB 1944]
MHIKKYIQSIVLALFVGLMSGCGSGGSEQNNASQSQENTTNQPSSNTQDNNNSINNGGETNNSGDSNTDSGNNSDEDENSVNEDENEQEPAGNDTTFSSKIEVSRFIQQATFGVQPSQLNELENTSASEWFVNQLDLPASLILPGVEAAAPADPEDEFSLFYIEQTSFSFWRNAIAGEDQLRQRIAFALSEILVVSNGGGEVLTDVPEAVAFYQDILITNAFGNYRTILEQVTYSPAMGHYLTYMGSEKGDAKTGRMPDENYARELLQLFTLGVVALNNDGTEKLNESGEKVELYNNTDITGLARVFTGLNLDEEDPEAPLGKRFSMPMAVFSESHSEKEKSFLELTIPEGTDAKTSITQALDHIFAHPNLAPFVTKQLIQRLVTSNPSSDYVGRVVTAFESGLFTLPDGQQVGAQQRGDLTATVAAILFDQEARTLSTQTGGKIREPILRFTQWARAFDAKNVNPQFVSILWETGASSALGQHPYRAPSVFNYFRPGYKSPGSVSAAQGLVAPELQITNASSIPGYVNFMTFFITGQQQDADLEELKNELEELGIEADIAQALESFEPDYAPLLAIADEPSTLVDYLDLILSAQQLSEQSRKNISDVLATVEADEDDGLLPRVQLGILMVMSSPDYLVQK